MRDEDAYLEHSCLHRTVDSRRDLRCDIPQYTSSIAMCFDARVTVLLGGGGGGGGSFRNVRGMSTAIRRWANRSIYKYAFSARGGARMPIVLLLGVAWVDFFVGSLEWNIPKLLIAVPTRRDATAWYHDDSC